MRTAGDQANVAVPLAFGLVIGLDDQQTCVLTLAARIGLQTDAGISGSGTQPGAQLCIQIGIPFALKDLELAKLALAPIGRTIRDKP